MAVWRLFWGGRWSEENTIEYKLFLLPIGRVGVTKTSQLLTKLLKDILFLRHSWYPNSLAAPWTVGRSTDTLCSSYARSMLFSKARLCILINSIVPTGHKKFMNKSLALLTRWSLNTRLFTVWCVFNGTGPHRATSARFCTKFNVQDCMMTPTPLQQRRKSM